ncbi:MAG: hypothetical protein DWH99_02580, partial [Planctomycetota bacterium]
MRWKPITFELPNMRTFKSAKSMFLVGSFAFWALSAAPGVGLSQDPAAPAAEPPAAAAPATEPPAAAPAPTPAPVAEPPAPAAPAPAPAAPVAPVAPAPVVYQSLAVFPPLIKISAQNDLQHIVAVATRADGITVDVTDQVQWK